MGVFVVSPASVLMISRRVARWVDTASPEIQRTFDDAIDFAATLLDDAVAQLAAFSAIMVLHENSVMVMRFDAATERFCVIAFYVDENDPLPPDGPHGGVAASTVAAQLMEHMGLFASPIMMLDFTDVATGDRAGVVASRRITVLTGVGLSRRDAKPNFPAERDFPKSRSKSITGPANMRDMRSWMRLDRPGIRPGVQTPETPQLS